MRSSFRPSISIIERTERLAGEPLMTQWLAHLLEYPEYRREIVCFLCERHFESKWLEGLSVEDETENSDSHGRPDVRIVGRDICLVIENKFDASLTKNQPNEYLKDLRCRSARYKGLVLVVPSWKERKISKLLEQSKAEKDGISAKVKTWEDLTDQLLKQFPKSELIQEFVREIQRRYKVMSPLRSGELEAALGGLQTFLRQHEFLKGLKMALEKTSPFAGKTIKVEKQPIREGEELYFGIEVRNRYDIVWIGFWNVNGSKTPILGHVYDNSSTRKLFPKFWSRLKVLQSRKTLLPQHDEWGWPVPIPIEKIGGNSIKEQADAAVRYFCKVLEGAP